MKHLPSYKAHEFDQGMLLVKETIIDFLWQRDSHKYSNVAIGRPGPEFLKAGYLASIKFHRPIDRKDLTSEEH
jgi:hypothetical protein